MTRTHGARERQPSFERWEALLHPAESRRPIAAADKAPKLFGDHGTECQHGTPASGPAVEPDDVVSLTHCIDYVVEALAE